MGPVRRPQLLPERIEPSPVVFDQYKGLFDLFGRHLLDHFFLRDGRVRITSDGRKDIPHISPDQIGRFDAPTNFVVPANPRLRPRVALESRAKIPFKGSLVVLRDTKSKRVHHTDQFLGLGVTRVGRRQKLFHRRRVVSGVHEAPSGLDLGKGRTGRKKREGDHKLSHGLTFLLALALGAPAYATDLPAPLQAKDFEPFDPVQAELGRLLFYDPILSGNKNISCATCHHPDHGSSDGLSLGVGEGGEGIGPKRTTGTGSDRIRKRIPRNAPALWNLGAREISVMFHDGRVTRSDIYENGFNTPAQEWLPEGLSGLLAVQALFPLTSQFEMAGDPVENEVAGAAYDRIDAVWPILAKRVRVIPEYGAMFVDAFDDVSKPDDITIVHIANALAAFEISEYQSFDSRFDRYLAGDLSALDDTERAGLELFYGKAGCADCHSGSLLTDQKFYALMLPHFGPGRTRQWDSIVRDVGHMAVSDRLDDAYRFRTPSLRNVALTGPYGHNGAYRTLEGVVRHHLDPRGAFVSWKKDQAVLPSAPWIEYKDFVSFDDLRERARLASRLDIAPVALKDPEIEALVAFLGALTGTESIKGRLGRPQTVPSGLEVQ